MVEVSLECAGTCVFMVWSYDKWWKNTRLNPFLEWKALYYLTYQKILWTVFRYFFIKWQSTLSPWQILICGLKVILCTLWSGRHKSIESICSSLSNVLSEALDKSWILKTAMLHNHTHVHTYIHTYIHTYMHTYIHTVHTYIHTYTER